MDTLPDLPALLAEHQPPQLAEQRQSAGKCSSWSTAASCPPSVPPPENRH